MYRLKMTLKENHFSMLLGRVKQKKKTFDLMRVLQSITAQEILSTRKRNSFAPSYLGVQGIFWAIFTHVLWAQLWPEWNAFLPSPWPQLGIAQLLSSHAHIHTRRTLIRLGVCLIYKVSLIFKPRYAADPTLHYITAILGKGKIKHLNEIIHACSL